METLELFGLIRSIKVCRGPACMRWRPWTEGAKIYRSISTSNPSLSLHHNYSLSPLLYAHLRWVVPTSKCSRYAPNHNLSSHLTISLPISQSLFPSHNPFPALAPRLKCADHEVVRHVHHVPNRNHVLLRQEPR